MTVTGNGLQRARGGNVGIVRPVSVCVAYATLGRAEILSRTFGMLARQTHPPSSVVISSSSVADAGDLVTDPTVTLLLGPTGSARQRNLVLRNLPPETDIVVFFDDDFIPHPNWIKTVVETFQTDPIVGAVTGNLLADGINGPGLTVDEAVRLVDNPPPGNFHWLDGNYSPYGCNMAFRVSMITDMSFDERLVLYGWLEDRDFGAALALRGAKLVKTGAALGVHMGVKRGRVPGVKLGYSQVVNPVYLHRKGTMRVGQVIDHVFRNVTSNLVRSAAPEPYVDRAGRLRGNIKGALDVLRGRFTPEKAALL